MFLLSVLSSLLCTDSTKAHSSFEKTKARIKLLILTCSVPIATLCMYVCITSWYRYKNIPHMSFDDVGREPDQAFRLNRDPLAQLEYPTKYVPSTTSPSDQTKAKPQLDDRVSRSAWLRLACILLHHDSVGAATSVDVQKKKKKKKMMMMMMIQAFDRESKLCGNVWVRRAGRYERSVFWQ